MMMDFGNSVEQVADKAGFSESTIRRRVKLLSLDREEFKKSVKRGATLADFALLDKLDTEEAKNEVLKSVGTNNFRACLDRALREQKDRKTMNAIREVVASYATKADSKADMPENCLFYASYGSWSGTAEAPVDAGEHAYWYTESGYGITVYRERTEEDKSAEKTPEQLAREAKIEEYREKCRVIDEDEESAYRLRLNYLKEYGFPKKAAEAVALAACRMMILNPYALDDMDEDTIEAVYGDGIYNDEHDLDTAVLLENAQVNPMKMLVVLLFAFTEPVNHRMHDTEWLGGYYKCIKDDESVYRGIYAALDGIGYEMSDMEKSLMGGDYVTLNQLVTAFNRTGSYSYKMISWVENRGLPVHNKRVQQNTFRVVYLKEFWTWAEKNRSFLDFSKLEPLAFGEEPAWVAEQRKRDFKACSLQRKDPWTPAEDAKLRMLLEQYKYTYEQMSDMLRRSPGAIQRRCADLGLKARPVRINPHGPEAVWHQEDYDRLAEGIKSGESYMSIGKALGKSEKAIRGKVYYCYLTENADKVRAMMAGGNWGDGAPEPTVWQARLLSRSRAEMQTTMTMLVEALNCRIQQVGYDPALEDHWNQYWQRTTCLHWDDLKHCTAGCTDCDSCAEYKKIPPQYCARCGATFYERKENTFCLQCRFDRKKQAQRHWCRVNAKRGERP